MKVTLRQVYKEDYRFLYKLLKLRSKVEYISHRGVMPSYKEHCKFNDNKPYTGDWIILGEDKPIGRLYLSKNNEVGIHCLPKVNRKYVIDELLDLFCFNHVYFNVSPKDKIINDYLKKRGLKLIQYTYENLH